MTKSSPLSEKTHTVNPYLATPFHPLSILVIGAGGNGSRMVSKLAQIHSALKMLDHPGLNVTLIDDDVVEKHNVGRQMFSKADVGKPKSVVCIERINRFFGTNWNGYYSRINDASDLLNNIIITCVDNNACRKIVHDFFKGMKPNHGTRNHESMPLYWLDMGNGKDRGQFNLSTPAGIKGRLKSLIDMYGYKKDDPNDNQPTCSAEESLQKQDLFVNDLLTTYVSNFLWTILKKHCVIKYQGMFLNFDTNIHSEIPIK